MPRSLAIVMRGRRLKELSTAISERLADAA